MGDGRRLRLGMLGCATVSDYSVLQPAREGARVEISAVAARDPDRAAALAAQHGIPSVFTSYAELVREADVDAIYIALPNGLHGYWALESLHAGRPVLCEKPLAANAEEAEALASAADAAGLPLVEALHWRDHPVAARIKELVASLGGVRAMSLRYSLPGGMLPMDNIRFDPVLAGGWLMDQGCYCTSLARFIAGEPEAVLSATADEVRPGLDGGMEAELRFAGDIPCRIGGSMVDTAVTELELGARIVCAEGTISIVNPYLPGANPFTREQGAQLIVERTDGEEFTESADLVSSWFCQANAFAHTLESWNGGPNPAWDAVANMRVIDAIYRAAGMEPRRPTFPRES